MHSDAAVILDVDGTLVDSNDAHARAWVDAFAEHGITVAFDHVRRSLHWGGRRSFSGVSLVRRFPTVPIIRLICHACSVIAALGQPARLR